MSNTRVVFSFGNEKLSHIQWYYDQDDAEYIRQYEHNIDGTLGMRLKYELINVDEDERQIK